MHKILLLDVGTPREELSEPLGIETITPYIEDNIPEVDLVLWSLELNESASLETLLKSNIFHIIGISTKIRTYDMFDKVIKMIRKFNNEAVIVVGDILGTYAYKEILDVFEDIICVRGEGEESMPGIIKGYIKYGNKALFNNLSEIPNLAYRYKNKNKITKRSVIDVANAKHPKRYFFKELYQQYGIVHLEASRGCIYSNCSFCGVNEKYNSTYWRPFSLDYVIKELEIISNANFRSPYFTDEDFFGNDIQRIIDFCNKVMDAKKNGRINPDLDFYINARVGSILGEGYGGVRESRSVLNLLKEAGLREIFIGIESGCKDQINRYEKLTDQNKNQKAIEILADIGIDLDIGFIFFDPQATIKDLRSNITFIKKAGIINNYSRIIKKLRVQPHTVIGNEYVKNNPDSKINMNLVCYEYEFKHREVSEIYNRFNGWEKGDLDIIYNMQSFCRGEIESESEREEVKSIISCYRYLDLEYLNALITAYENNLTSENYLYSVTEQYKAMRECFDNNLIDKMKWYDSSFRRYRRKRYE